MPDLYNRLIIVIWGDWIEKNILSRILSRINYRWQNFIEDMFGMGNFSCLSYKNEQQKVLKKQSLQL